MRTFCCKVVISPISNMPQNKYIDDATGEQFDNFETLLQIDFFKVYYYGSERFYKKGIAHREDGPALIYTKGFDGSDSMEAYFYLEGENYSEEEWLEKISKENRIKYLFEMTKYQIA